MSSGAPMANTAMKSAAQIMQGAEKAMAVSELAAYWLVHSSSGQGFGNVGQRSLLQQRGSLLTAISKSGARK